MDRLISFTEKAILLLVACFTVYGVTMEMLKVFSTGKVELTDLLLMFIYAEVLGMVGAFYKSNTIPISIPIFIAVTALCRLVILQGKEASAINLIYEAGAVLLLAIAAYVIRLKSPPGKSDVQSDH
ncbi:MAG: phosphate starvation-inducible protein PhoH [Betaproteobacteria bacterium]|nr:phosphate starvation-inducible protein PhoH [Betaproteobacteria bacterium]